MPPDEVPPRPAERSVAARLRERCGVDVDPRIRIEAGPSPAESAARAPAQPSAAVLERLGARGEAASRYETRGEIARGGMGAILEVTDQDLRRTLAMKVILDGGGGGTAGGTADPVKLARFLEEAQVTGQLDHPGIVPVHELGLDAQGQVYFTMRLVRGRDLAAIYERVAAGTDGWTMTRALGALLRACEALAYAHSKGVIHRDLKPANVMVGEFGEVYVMDWGLARVRDHADRHDLRLQDGAGAERVRTDRASAATTDAGEHLRTMDGDVMGTPSYMAPEQARGEVAALDERTDVYALGAMLYHLLAGAAPYSARDEQPSAVTVWKRVLEGPPPALEQLAPDAPPELIAIAAKAMAREPVARYADMRALSEDLRAFLEGRVVRAFETGAWAEARKWVRRNRPLAAALASAVLALAGGLVASLILAERARANADLAEKRRVAADDSAASARRQARIAAEVNAFLNDDLLASVAPEREGIDVKVRDVLDRAAARLAGRFADEPEIESALRLSIGTSYLKLGEFEPARVHLERALELRRAHDGERSDPALRVMERLASAWAALGRREEAAALLRAARGIAEELFGAEHPAAFSARSDLAILLKDQGDFDGARAVLEELRPIEERALGEDHPDTLATLNNLALVDQKQGRLEAAVRLLEDVLARRTAAHGERHPETVIALDNLAQALGEAGSYEESERLGREAYALHGAVHGPDHPLTGRSAGNLALLLTRRGRPTEAEPLFADALRIARAAYGEEAPDTLRAQSNLTACYEELGRAAEVIPLKQATLAAQRRVLGPEHPETLTSMNNLASSLRVVRRFDEAEALFRETVEIERRVLGADHPRAIATYENLAGLLFQKGELESAETMTREVLDARRRVLGADHPDVAKTTMNLGMVIRARGDDEGALAIFQEALDLSRAAGDDANPVAENCLKLIGDGRLKAREYALAIEAYREAWTIARALHPDDALTAYFLHQIGYGLDGKGEREAAVEAYNEALALRERLQGKDAEATLVTLNGLSNALIGLGRHAEAETHALAFHERALRALGADHAFVGHAAKLLVRLYESWDKPDEAARWRR